MSLTKEERRQIYLQAKEIFIKYPKHGMCLLLEISYKKHLSKRGISNASVNYAELLDLFPEFNAIKPEDKTVGEYWFDNKRQRLAAFDKIIKETKSNGRG
jgi:hypothetical protein